MPDLQPPDVFRLLGDDLRWRLAAAMARSDRRVNELVESVGKPQNLVSYHLGLLKRSRLVSERRSSYDRRDVYYHLDLDRLCSDLTGAAAALHPSLRPSLPPGRAARGASRRARVLFICTGNSARSQMAEAIFRQQSPDAFEVHSAGPAPAGVHPLALSTLSELQVESSGLRSKSLDEVAHTRFDFVISLCDIAREECPPLPGTPEYMHWSLPDPAAVSGSLAQRRTAFRSTAKELAHRIEHFLQLATQVDGPPSKSAVGGAAHG